MNTEFLFEKAELIPAIVQDTDGTVLMLAYMNRQSLDMTLQSGKCTFYSRSRSCLWTKGETSGNIMYVRTVYYDCDCDTLLIAVDSKGHPACHTGARTCFYRKLEEKSHE